MSQNNLVIAISALSAALEEAGLTGVTITVGAPSVLNTVNTVTTADVAVEQKEAEVKGGRGRRNADKDAAKEETKTEAVEEKQEETKTETKGRRGRGAAKEEPAETETKSRRGRTSSKKEEELINDNEEQAETRARLIEDLRTLADHDEAIDDVTEALQRTGAANIKAVPSSALEQLDDDIGAIFDKYGL